MSVSPSAYLKNRTRNFTKFSVHVTYVHTVARSSSDDNAITYILPVPWRTSCLHKMGQVQTQAWSLRIM